MSGYNTVGITHRVIDENESMISHFEDLKLSNTMAKIKPGKLDIAPPDVSGQTIIGKSPKKILRIMMQNIDITLLNSRQLQFSPSESSMTNKFFCPFCLKLELKAKLACGHSACLSCLFETLNKLERSSVGDVSVLKHLESLRCRQCLLLPTRYEIFELFNQSLDRYNQFFSLQFKKICSWCKRTLNFFNHFYPELKCLHLCKDCYIDQLFCKIDNCMVCQEDFSNKLFTMRRSEKCLECQKELRVVNFGLKCYKNGMICFNCQNNFYRNEEQMNQMVLDMNMTIGVFFKFYAKACGTCGTEHALSDIRICQYCKTIVCEECKDRDFSCAICKI